MTAHRRRLRVNQRADGQVFLSASRRPLYDSAWSHISSAAQQRMPHHWEDLRLEKLSSVMAAVRLRIDHSRGYERTTLLLALLILQAPQASRAQDLMKRRGVSFNDREERLHELIEFNDTFVSLVLSFDPLPIPRDIKDNIYYEIHRVCTITRTHPFSYLDYNAISRGLEREIALYFAAEVADLDVRVASRIADGLGVDMQVSDRESGLQVNIDCKTESSFRFKLDSLVRYGRIKQVDRLRADEDGVVKFSIGRGKEAIPVVLLRITESLTGGVEEFRFRDEHAVGVQLRNLVAEYGTKRKLIL